MIFTHSEWRQIDDNTLIVSAAPFPPMELGRNRKYVFALPPRFTADALPGWKEVFQLMDEKPLRTF